MACVECRTRAFAGQAIAVLGGQRVEALVADSACRVDRLCPGVRTDDAETPMESPRGFDTQRIVIAVATVLHILDIAKSGPRRSRGCASNGPWNRLVDVLEALQVPALPAQVPGLDRPVRSHLPLNVEQILHGITGVMVGLHGVGKRRRHVSSGAA